MIEALNIDNIEMPQTPEQHLAMEVGEAIALQAYFPKIEWKRNMDRLILAMARGFDDY